MTNRDLLKEAIADAKAVKETAIANAKAALEESFAPRMREMLAAKLAEMDSEAEKTEKVEEAYSVEEEETMEENYMEEKETMEEEKMEEELDLEALLKELEGMDENINLTAFPDEPGEHGNVAGQNVTEAEEMGEEEEEEIDLENMSEEDLKSFIESVISDMVSAGELEAGHEGEEGEEKEGEEEELKENASLNENLDLSTWRVLTGPGGMIFQIQGPNKGVIDARVNRKGMVSLDGEREEGVQAIKQIAKQFGTTTNSIYGDGLSTVITKSEFNSTFPETLDENKMAKEGELEEVKKELDEALKTISTIKTELSEVNLFNAKLLYTNKIFKAKNLTESQKVKVLEAFDKATSIKETKLVFETLSEGLKEKKSQVNESLLRGSASKPSGVAEKKPILEVDNQFARWQKLAGIKN